MSVGGLLLWPNFGGEEGLPPALAPDHPLRSLARCWALLFGARAHLAGEVSSEPRAWPADFGPAPASPAWAGLPASGGFPWLPTSESERALAERGAPPTAGPTELVARLHDKAWAREQAARLGVQPATWLEHARSFDPAELNEPAFPERLRGVLETWPAALAERFVLKPRSGTTGRGCAQGRDGLVDRRLLASLPRLASRGGAVLEPWVERVCDLSTQLLVEPDGGVKVLGTTRLLVRPSGMTVGLRGLVDGDGRSRAGTPHDAAAAAAAAELVTVAAREGFRGPCGVDAFAHLDAAGVPCLRPVVELNARCTVGTIAVGLLRRLAGSGRRRDAGAWLLALRPVPPGPPGVREPSLGPGSAPRLLLARSPLELDEIAAALVRPDAREGEERGRGGGRR